MAVGYQMEGEGNTSIQAVQSYICTHWTRLLSSWTGCFSAALDGCASGFPSKMLANEDAGLDSVSLRDLRSATDLALRPTKATAQAIGRSMSSLIVLERHLWLTMTEMKEADKVPFLDAPILSGSLFGLAVEGFAERFTESQKSSQAVGHFLPKRTSSSSASSRLKSAPAQQTAKPAPTTPEPRPLEERRERGRSRSARRYNFPKRQGPLPKIALDPVPKKSL